MKQISFAFAFILCVVSCSKKDRALSLQSMSEPTSSNANKPPPPPPPTLADPAIVFYENVSTGRYNKEIKVMNADGSNQTVILQGTRATMWSGLSWSPNALNYVYTKGPQGLWIDSINLVNGKPTLIREHQIPIILPNGSIYPGTAVWSPNGNLIAFSATENNPNYGPDGHIYTIPPTGGTATIVYTSPPGYFSGSPAWSPDGTKLAFLETDTLFNNNPFRLMVLDLTGNNVTTVFTQDNTYDLGWPQWSRNGDRIAFTNNSTSPSGIFTVTPTANASPIFVINGSTDSWSPNDAKMLFTNSTGGFSTYTFSDQSIVSIYQRPKEVVVAYGADWRRF